jgi:hypothetical protein
MNNLGQKILGAAKATGNHAFTHKIDFTTTVSALLQITQFTRIRRI